MERGIRHIAVLAVLSIVPTFHLTAQALSPRDSALRVLNRLAYGPRPGEVDSVARFGVMRWIERQLEPERLRDDRLAERVRAFTVMSYDREALAQRYMTAQRERREMQREMAATGDSTRRGSGPMREFRQLGGELQQLAVVRAIFSEAQLREVMVDFWTNHFNVFLGKGADRFLMPSYIEETIRPRALGRFDDLLIATAESPAMLFYLDNAQSIAPGASPPGPLSARRRGGTVRTTGINENYARELLELHTLGVDGGYTQKDVVEVARIFTGWSIARPIEGAGFVFRDWAHDRGDKHVLGVTFKGGGKDEGVRLLHFLANHHATMHHVSAKLCARFVADEPPDGCVDAAVGAWHRTGGDIRAVLRAIFTAPDFWAPQTARNKTKTPLEFLVSAVRATGAEPDETIRLAQVVTHLGQPLYLQPAPTGYGETEAHWVNSGALLARMNVAVGLAAARLPGVTVNLDEVVPLTTNKDELVTTVNQRILAGTMSQQTRTVILSQLADLTDPVRARALAVGLALGGPEFQKQ